MEKYWSAICLGILTTCCCTTVTSNVECLRNERVILLAVKAQWYDQSSVALNSWKGLNCCEWLGVQCSNFNSHVIQLHFAYFLGYSTGPGALTDGDTPTPPSLVPLMFKLKYLEYLDLSYNGLTGALPR
ncbi:hypothetical protein KI387_021657, partial [Taxus chinensis]